MCKLKQLSRSVEDPLGIIWVFIWFIYAICHVLGTWREHQASIHIAKLSICFYISYACSLVSIVRLLHIITKEGRKHQTFTTSICAIRLSFSKWLTIHTIFECLLPQHISQNNILNLVCVQMKNKAIGFCDRILTPCNLHGQIDTLLPNATLL